MKTSFRPAPLEDSLKSLYSLVNLHERQEIRLYKSLNLGLTEVTKGLITQYPHKKTIGFVEGTHSIIDDIKPFFSKEGYLCQSISLSDLDQFEVDKDLIMVIGSLSDPLTGELFDLTAFEEKLKGKRVYFIAIDSYWRDDYSSENPFRATIVDLGKNLSVGFLCGRVRPERLELGQTHWTESEVEEIKNQMKKAEEDRDRVLEFEKNFGSSLNHDSRLFDRAVIKTDGVDATSVVQYLKRKNENLSVLTTSPSFWPGLNSTSWLLKRSLSRDRILSTMIVPLVDLDFVKENLPDALSHIQELQGI